MITSDNIKHAFTKYSHQPPIKIIIAEFLKWLKTNSITTSNSLGIIYLYSKYTENAKRTTK